MATTIPRVQPGDLITAERFNAMIDALTALQAQVGGLSSGQANQVIISDLIPPSGTVKVGHPLEVLGQHFRFEAGGLSVYIDDFRVNLLTSANDTRLVFNIPTDITPAVTQDRPALLTINNGLTSAQRTIVLQPALALSGAVDVIPEGTSPTTPVPGQFTLSFRLRSRASVDATYTIVPTVSVGAWQPSVQVLEGSPLATNASRQIFLAAGQETVFAVRLTIPTGTAGTAFNVTVGATSGTIGGTSGVQAFTVGTAAPQPDTTITLGFASAQVFGAGTVDSSRIALGSGASATLRLSASFTIAATYEITAAFIGGATNWESQRVVSTTPSPMPITSGELAAGNGIVGKTLEFGVRPLAGATNGRIEFRVLRSGQPQPRTFTMDVQVV